VGDEERELERHQTAWVRGLTDTKMGQGILTTERILFFDQKFAANAAFGLANIITDHLQKRHEDGGPMLDLPLTSITGVRREKKMLNKDRIALTTTDGEYLFNDGWKAWSPLLRDALAVGGRRIVDRGGDAFAAEPV
jgi:hypothetical protein